MCQQPGENRRAESDSRTDRQIDSTRDDNHRHAECRNADHRRLSTHGASVV